MSLSNATRYKIYQREGFQCALCSDNRNLMIHHIVKRSQGGSDERSNLIALCYNCHSAVHDTQKHPTMTKEDFELAIVEYISDYYASRGYVWTPQGTYKHKME